MHCQQVCRVHFFYLEQAPIILLGPKRADGVRLEWTGFILVGSWAWGEFPQGAEGIVGRLSDLLDKAGLGDETVEGAQMDDMPQTGFTDAAPGPLG